MVAAAVPPAQSKVPPVPPSPLIPLDLVDGPTQRLYVVSSIVLVQAFKISDFIIPILSSSAILPTPGSTLLSSNGQQFDSKFWKWILIDFLLICIIQKLHVPRLTFGLLGVTFVVGVLVTSDWLCFGEWKFSVGILVPSFLRALLVTYQTTSEQSVRLSTVRNKEYIHLGGQFTVHMLAISTAQLNPSSKCYCLPLASANKDPIYIPLLVNNTTPSGLTYSITSLTDPPSIHTYSVPASSLILHSNSHKTSSKDFDVEEWWNSPDGGGSKSDPDQALSLHHQLPVALRGEGNTDEITGSRGTERIYYLPVNSPGVVQLESVSDKDGHQVRIRRKRETEREGSIISFEGVRILQCPRAGFAYFSDSERGGRETHTCMDRLNPQSMELGLIVQGSSPLSVSWTSGDVDLKGTVRKRASDELNGILGIQRPANVTISDEVIQVPINVSVSSIGRKRYFLDKVTDGCGNTVDFSSLYENMVPLGYDPEGKPLSPGQPSKPQKLIKASSSKLIEGSLDSRDFIVHSRPTVAFGGACDRGSRDVRLLNGGSTWLEVKIGGIDEDIKEQVRIARIKTGNATPRREELVNFRIGFTPEEQEEGWPQSREFATSLASFKFEIKQPGTYELLQIKGKHCGGVVLVPNTCRIVLQPEPTFSVTFDSIEDVCKSDVGLVANIDLTGSPPFSVFYELIEHLPRNQNHTQLLSKRFTQSRDQLRLEPGPGDWEYRFLGVSDNFYPKKIDAKAEQLQQFKRRQAVQLVSSARWKDAEKGHSVKSCHGSTVSVEVELKGNSPWEIEYLIAGQTKKSIKDIKTTPYAFDIDIPPSIVKKGGTFALSLQNVKDNNGCQRPVNAPDLIVDVRRTKPTARFNGPDGSRAVLIKEIDSALIPLRLTGEGPWEITYEAPSVAGRKTSPITIKRTSPNSEISIQKPIQGVYKLLSVKDSFCPGEVTDGDWTIATITRPKMAFQEGIGAVVKNGSVIRKAVCENVADSIGIVFTGKPPFRAVYKLRKGSQADEPQPRTLSSTQVKRDLTLYTSTSGHHSYEFTGIADSVYNDLNKEGLSAPNTGHPGVLRLEQDVFAIPKAEFKHGPKRTFCVNDNLASREKDDFVMYLTGQPPFEVELEVREEGHRSLKRFTITDIKTREWPVQVPLSLETPLVHSVTIRKIRDGNGCENVNEQDVPRSSTSISVAEIASITAVVPKKDHCVGDFLDFVVQGSPPFIVTYTSNGESHHANLKTSTFTRLADKPAQFTIVSVGHGHDECRANNVNIVKKVHPIPTAQVSMGGSTVVDLREGDQTEITFTFTGTPPFTFTYSRRQPQDRSKDKTVLETHTMTGIMDYSYSIYTAQEGTWTVSSIADAYCSYPPASVSTSDALVQN